MKKTSLEKNSAYIILRLVWDFFISSIASVWLFFRTLSGRSSSPLRENSFLDGLNFILQIGPRSFWKRPSGIKIGRSISTLLHYIFEKERSFYEVPKKK